MSFTFGGPSSPFKPKYMRGAKPAPAPAQPGLPTLKPQEQYLQNQIQKTTQSYAPPLPTGTDPAPKQTVQYAPPPLPMGTEPAPNPQAAAAAGAARAANVGAAAANRVGEQQQVAQGNAQANASTTAGAAAGYVPAPPADPYALKAADPLTAQGKLYNESVLSRMQGNDPLVKNAQATADTQASRNNYYARTNALEGAAQAKFAPGTIQYQRMTDEAQAGANAANLTGQNNVNQFTRDRSAEAMGMGAGIEKDAYGNAIGERNFRTGREDVKYQRGVDERGYTDSRADLQFNRDTAAEDKTYTRGITERTYQDTKALLAKGDITGAINSVQSQKAKNYLNGIRAQGGDVNAAIAGLYEGNGTLKAEFRDSSPVADIRSQAEEWINLTMPGVDPATKEAAILQRMKDLDATRQGPIDDESEARASKDALVRINDGKQEDGDFEKAVSAGLIEKYTSQTLPIDAGARALIGKTISYADKQYEVVANGRVVNTRDGDTHTSYVVLQDPDGGIWYKAGATLSKEPPRNLDHGKDYEKYAVYDPNTKTLTYKTTKA